LVLVSSRSAQISPMSRRLRPSYAVVGESKVMVKKQVCCAFIALLWPALLIAQTSLPQSSSAPTSQPQSIAVQPQSAPTPPKKPEISPELLPFVPIVDASVSATQTTLGGIVTYTLTIERAKEVNVVVPDPLNFGRSLRIRNTLPTKTEETPNGVKETRSYELQVFGLETVEVPAFTFDFRAPAGIARVASPALKIEVPKTLPPKEDLNDKFTPRDIEPAEAAWLTWLKAYGPYLGVLLLASAIAYVVYKKRKQKPQEEVIIKKEDPFEVAIKRLDKLEKEKPAAKEFHLILSETLREYVEDALQITAREATSAELLTRLQKNATPTTEKINRAKLEYFLAENDMVKFAKQVPSLPELLQSLEFVRSLVVDTKPKVQEPA
jgi:hypothetical protein